MNEPIHITSVLITAQPRLLCSVTSALSDMPIVEIAHTESGAGKVIITMETGNESEIVQALTDIQLIDGVASASLVFHQIDDPEQQTDHRTELTHD